MRSCQQNHCPSAHDSPAFVMLFAPAVLHESTSLCLLLSRNWLSRSASRVALTYRHQPVALLTHLHTMSALAASSASSSSSSSGAGAAEFCDSTVAKISYHDFIRELKKNLLVIVGLWREYSSSVKMLFLVEFNTLGSLTEVWEEAMRIPSVALRRIGSPAMCR